MAIFSTAPYPRKAPLGTPLAQDPLATGSALGAQFGGPVRPWMVLPLNEGKGRNVRELCAQRQNVVGSASTWISTQDGPALAMTGSSNDGVVVRGVPPMPDFQQHGFTLEAILNHPTNHNWDSIISRCNAGIPEPIDWYIDASVMRVFLGTGGSQSGVTMTAPPVGQRNHILISCRLNTSGVNWTFITVVNGISQGAVFMGAGIHPVDTGRDILVGRRNDNVPIMVGNIAFAALWSGAMTVSQMVARSRSPWSIFSTDALYPAPGSGVVPPPTPTENNWHFLNPQFGLYAAYLAATDSRLSSLRIEFPTRAVVLKGPQADAAVMWWIQNTPPSLRWQS